MDLIDYSSVSHGTRGIFGKVEREANRHSAICLVMLAIVAILLVSLASLVDHSEYMHEVRWSMTALIVICLSVGITCLVKKTETRSRKYILFFAWFAAIMLAVTFVDSSVSLLYAIPVLLVIRYNSVIFTIFVSLFNIIFAFFPFLINTYRNAFPLDFVVLKPGTTITITGASLDSTANALGDSLLRNQTIINMLSYGYLAVVFFLILLSLIAVTFTSYNRKLILDQYKRARNMLEENK